ncbi:hypothetical protein TVAG_114270 [Trichomonas vaginalis G3]|uniref:Anaphase-promoting complex subunit 4 WD40 domain-containing protein n=1 Tax=Trichomonas vaginalis (strain ATCC PRA-98 / G3) TaxID=412133 RepID=A2F3V4_TRIV3|nr:WD40 repeat-like family [Trichomonas vaginalis G3]EAY00423.1 hypothetical protein TVAG_114270 [Trichomonas vaginalis G3]KAI5526564.1 WD40 repeat-like family [Trichomonas vaginalis G3]|eukprot:XP_001313352.1 hypothetical protein [Trichomonas vaginalis G3]
MKTILARTDPSCSFSLALTEDSNLIVYSISKNILNVLTTFHVDCIDAQFLPSSLGLAFIIAEKDGSLTIYRQDMAWKTYKIENFKSFSSCLRVSPYPPEARIGCISNGEIMIFNLLFEQQPTLLPIRRFAYPNKFKYFNFGLNDTIFAVYDDMIWRFNFNKKVTSEPFKTTDKPVAIEPNPCNADLAAIIFENDKVGIIGIVDGIFSERLLTPIQHNVHSVKNIMWSPLGTSLLIGGDIIEEWKEVSPGNWCLSK